jgi:DNA-directed RNA polymerase specialized sigma24 family protein
MRYIRNPAGNRIVVATAEETHALRPAIRASYRRWKAPDGSIDDFCQEVEIVAWRGIVEQRIVGDRFQHPEDALLNFMFMVAWNVWRNHTKRRSTRNEVFVDELPDMAGPSPEGRLDARETLLRLAMREDVARVLLDAVNVPATERVAGLPRNTYYSRLTQARSWARDVDAGQWREPRMPDPSTPKHRKKKR